jgi:transmembrane sensor
MTMSPTEHSKAAEEAAWWLHRLKQDHTPEVQAAFVSWVRKASIHLEEFLFAQAIWRELDQVDPTLRARYEDGVGQRSVVDFPATREAPMAQPLRSRRRLPWKIGVAAMLAMIAIAAILWAAAPFGANMYATVVGEQRAIKLADGSVMHLNTRTRAEVHYSSSSRTVRLQTGEALFTVERDPLRPFVVITDSARVRALGTAFNVYRRSEGDTHVSVVDGAVQLTVPGSQENSTSQAAMQSSSSHEIRLARGDEAQVVRGRIVRTEAPDVQRAVAWRARELVFSGRPVEEIAAEFNRYNKAQIRVEGETLQKHRMSGVFAADDPTPFVRFLSKEPGVAVTRDGDKVVIQATDVHRGE